MSDVMQALPVGCRVRHYRIESVLRSEASGFAYLALNVDLQVQVVLEEFFPMVWAERGADGVRTIANAKGQQVASGQQHTCFELAARRFLAEARALARLHHDHVMRVIDCFAEHGGAFRVIDYEPGETLEALLQSEGTLSEGLLQKWLEQSLAALAATHTHGLLHADLRPENIYIRDRDGGLTLIGFGAIARTITQYGGLEAGVTAPAYAAPECYPGAAGEYGPGSDLYALAAMIYRGCTGLAPPLVADREQKNELDMSSVIALGRYSLGFLNVVKRALALRQENRFESAAAMHAALVQVTEASGEPSPLRDVAPAVVKSALPPLPDVTPAVAKSAPPPRSVTPRRRAAPAPKATPVPASALSRWLRPRVLLAVAAVGISLLTVVVVAIVFESQPEREPSETPSPIPAPSTETAVIPTSPASTMPPESEPELVSSAVSSEQVIATPKPGDIWRESFTGMEFVWIPDGCFRMGSPLSEAGRKLDETQQRVCVEGFWLSRYEVANAQYREFRPRHDSGDYQGHTLNDAHQPVVKINWSEAVAYANWLSRQGDDRFRLPTEAEWEYAARAGSETPYFWGETLDPAMVNFSDKNDPSGAASGTLDDGHAVAALVGSYNPNTLRLYDMLGNVWEWTCSVYTAKYDAEATRCAQRSDSRDRVRRGGAWGSGEHSVRAAYRSGKSPGFRSKYLGFRLLREP